MSPDPHAELRSRIVRKLRSDEWMERHFGISAHAEDVADAVMELFPDVRSKRLMLVDGKAYPIPAEVEATHTRYVLRTAPEPITDGGTP